MGVLDFFNKLNKKPAESLSDKIEKIDEEVNKDLVEKAEVAEQKEIVSDTILEEDKNIFNKPLLVDDDVNNEEKNESVEEVKEQIAVETFQEEAVIGLATDEKIEAIDACMVGKITNLEMKDDEADAYIQLLCDYAQVTRDDVKKAYDEGKTLFEVTGKTIIKI